MKHNRFMHILTAVLLPCLVLAACASEPIIRNDVLDASVVLAAADIDKQSLTYTGTEEAAKPGYTASYTEAEDMPQPAFPRDGKYDVYTDADNVTYRYFAGTDILCGVMSQLPEKEPTAATSVNATRSKADAFLAGLLTTAGGYEYLSRSYDETTGVHCIRYSYRVQRVDTEDIVAVFVTDKCDVVGWSALKLGDYYGIVLDSELLAESIAVMKSNAAGVDDLTFTGLGYDDNGILCCTFGVNGRIYAVPLKR